MKKRITLLLSILMLFMFTGIVKAEEDNQTIEDDETCSVSELSELRAMAAKVKVTYVPGEMSDTITETPLEGAGNNSLYSYIDVKMFNMTSQLSANVTIKGVSGNIQKTVGFKDIDVNGDKSITFRQQISDRNVEYEFRITGYYRCMGEVLRKITFTVPRFNYYSTLPICEEVPDYYLCQPYVTFDTSNLGETAYDKIEAYKEKLKNNEIIDVNTEEPNVVSQTISFFSKYKYIIVGLIIAIGVAITVIITKRKKSAL